MKKPVFVGSSVAIVTPFKDGKVDYDALLKLIEIQKNAGTAAITVCGTTGEASTMSPEERYNVIRFAKSIAGETAIIAGTGSNSTMTALQSSLDAERAGADALLLVTPYYNKATQKGLIEHYLYIADRVKTPMILYNVPSRTGVSFKAETYYELSKHPNINGIKEASGDFALLTSTLAKCGDEMNIWSGNDDIIVPMMALGAKGVISVAANVIPQKIAEMTHLCLQGNFKDAAKLQVEYNDLISSLFVEVNPIPVKTAMELLGLCSGELRLPLCSMSDENLEKLKKSMRNAGLI